MPKRHVMNSADAIVAEALEGFELSQAGKVRWNRDPSYIVRADHARNSKVGILSGGGSGHEPLHIGFVGKGMLDAAVPGVVFASPSAAQIAAATAAVDTGNGVVQIVKNYTGDVMNFEIGAALAKDRGVRVEAIIVDDDLATSSDDADGPGRRGTTGTVIVEKLCGAAAEMGQDVSTIVALGKRLVSETRSLSLALAPCTHPGHGKPSFDLPDDQVEFGVGIHGERGTGRHPFANAHDLVASLVSPLKASLGLHRGDRVLAIVNGLGSTHLLELNLAYREFHYLLSAAGISVERSLVGSFVTALDMSGLSVTLTRIDDDLLNLWDAPVTTYALTW
jgi:phosphoenolpyruvate---glycerone phosphotransferase subunit DhaK